MSSCLLPIQFFYYFKSFENFVAELSYEDFPSHISQLPYRMKIFIGIKISLTANLLNLNSAYRVLLDLNKSFNDSLL